MRQNRLRCFTWVGIFLVMAGIGSTLDRANAVGEQTFGASDQRLHERLVQYRCRAATHPQSAGAGFGISFRDGSSHARLQNESAGRKNRCPRLFAEKLFAGQ